MPICNRFKFYKFIHLKASFGFTLLEIMIAVCIIAIVFTAVFKMHSQTISMNNASRFYTIAPLLAQREMANNEIKSIDELTDYSEDYGDEFSGYSCKCSITEVESEVLGSVSKNLKQIDITIFFNDDEYTYNFRAYRFMQD